MNHASCSLISILHDSECSAEIKLAVQARGKLTLPKPPVPRRASLPSADLQMLISDSDKTHAGSSKLLIASDQEFIDMQGHKPSRFFLMLRRRLFWLALPAKGAKSSFPPDACNCLQANKASGATAIPELSTAPQRYGKTCDRAAPSMMLRLDVTSEQAWSNSVGSKYGWSASLAATSKVQHLLQLFQASDDALSQPDKAEPRFVMHPAWRF